MDKALAVQLQIRHNAEELSSTLNDMSSWEKKMKEKDTLLRRGKSVPNPRSRKVTREGGTIQLKSSGASVPSSCQNSRAPLTPASIVDSIVPASTPGGSAVSAVPSARGRYEHRDLEEAERELGNAEFKAGNFSAAVKCYTKCLGLKYQNYVAFSNRAMAYIKLKEYVRAVIDCDCALNIEPTHVKSLLRRATALNALGKHRAALLDLLAAQDVEPSNKQVRSDSTNTRELLRAAVNRAPHTPMRSYDELLAVHRQHRQARGNHQDSATESTNGEVVDTKAVQKVNEEQEEDEGILQGPDPLPASFATTPPPSPSAASATTSHAHDTQRDDKKENNNNNKKKKKEYVTGVRIPISLASDDDDDDDKEKKREREQDASRRGKATSSVGTTEADSRLHRVAISAESDDGSSSDDDDADNIPPPTAASSSSSSPHPPGSAQRPAVVGKSTTHVKIKTTSNTPTTKKKATSSGGKSTKSGGSPTKPSSSSSLSSSSQRFSSSSSSSSSGGGVLGAYELEKALVQAQGHVPALHRLLASLQPAHDASRIFQSVVEPEAMVLLLESLWHVIVSPPLEGDALTTDHFWQWCYALQALPSFPLLYSLVSREGAQSLQEHLRSLQQSSPWKGHGKKMQVVLGKFC